MRKQQPKPGQIGQYWLSKKPGREGNTDAWCRTWYDAKSRQTRRVSLGTSDFQEASLALAQIAIVDQRPVEGRPDDVLIEEVLLRFWEHHGRHSVSAVNLKREIALWQEFWAGKTVAEITPSSQREFRDWIKVGKRKELKKSSIDKILSAGRSALKAAVRDGELLSAPFIRTVETASEKRNRPPKGRVVKPVEIAQYLDSIKSFHLFAYVIIGLATLARPAAILDLKREQFDADESRLDLNPPGRSQTRKFRPIIPVGPTLRNWLSPLNDPQAHYISWKGHRLQSIDITFDRTREAAGLGKGFTPYSLRHSMSRALRKRKVSLDEIGLILGHLPQSSSATTTIYAPMDPDYCNDAISAIELELGEIQKCLKSPYDLRDPQTVRSYLAELETPQGHLRDSQKVELENLIMSQVPPHEIHRQLGISYTTIRKHRLRLKDRSGKPTH